MMIGIENKFMLINFKCSFSHELSQLIIKSVGDELLITVFNILLINDRLTISSVLRIVETHMIFVLSFTMIIY